MLYISEVNWRITCLLLSFSILNKVESSQMSALCFKLFRLSYSVLTFKSLKEKIHLLSWNYLLFMCVICTFWMQTKNTAESLLERPGTRSPLFRCQSCCSEMHSIRLLMLPHKVYSPDENSEKLSRMPLGLLSASWSFFLPFAGSSLCWCFCSESCGYSKG